MLYIDQRFRKKKYAKIIFNGIKLQILSSLGFVKHHIEHQNKKKGFDITSWKERQEEINKQYKLLNSYGYKGRSEYFDSVAEDDPELELLDIISDINKLAITSDDLNNHINVINEFDKELEASEKVLHMLEKMAPVVSSSSIETIEEIDDVFDQQECSLLLNMPSIINYEKILSNHYCYK